MTTLRYDELPVWHPAISLARKALRLTQEPVFTRHPEFVRNFEAAAVGVGTHIAAGVADGRENVLIDEVCQACSCIAKVRAMIAVLDTQPDKEAGEGEVGKLKVLARRMEQYLQAWSAKLRGVPLPPGPSEPPAKANGRHRPPPTASAEEDDDLPIAEAVPVAPQAAAPVAPPPAAPRPTAPPPLPAGGKDPAAALARAASSEPAADTSSLEAVLAELAGQQSQTDANPFAELDGK
ncbi:MAG: hypothetical protein BIFFINMI_02768 [Phycisphaerae bacterium]|nr:hypothetical protein [Phycisphaerae bacterium]